MDITGNTVFIPGATSGLDLHSPSLCTSAVTP